MTIKELSKYYDIKTEIEQLNSNLKELDATFIGSSKLTGMPHKKGTAESHIESITLAKSKVEGLLERKKKKLLDEQLKIESFLETVEDSKVRIIIRARFIDGKSWSQIGKELNFERTTPYYHLKKYLKGRLKNEEEQEKSIVSIIYVS